MYNIAGYADEARTRVEWYRRPLDAPEISASFDGQPFTAGGSVFGFDGPRIIAGVEFAL